MDDRRFDALAKTFAASSRRQVWQRLAAGALGGLLARVGGRAVAAQEDIGPAACLSKGKPCSGAGQCCSGCCDRGLCRRCCPPLSRCGNVCLNLHTDDNNCGACGNRCPEGTFCRHRQCQAPGNACPVDADFCGDLSLRCSPVGKPACGCHRTAAGEARCLSQVRIECAACGDDAQCAFLGDGAACVSVAGCGICAATGTACLLPCADPNPGVA